MTTANTALKISETDFDTIRDNLKSFLENRDELLDYDFDSSLVSLLLDILAYNTYHRSFYLNMVGNEMFLDSAERRENAVSRAKQQGYTPRSVTGASAMLDVTVSPDDDPTSVTVSKNSRFTTTIDGVTYTFVTPETTIITANTSGGFETTLEIVEGEPLTHRFTVDSSNPTRYEIPNAGIDTDSLVVKVEESDEDDITETYTLADDVTEIDDTSRVYFLQENTNGRYEIEFGDDVLGRSVENGNEIIVEYRVSNGPATNGAKTFTGPSTLGGYSNFTFSVNTPAGSGSERETIASIKRNAPKSFEAQDRTVTTRDYEQLIKSEFGFVESVSAWGGEENDPPTFGRVYVSAVPNEGTLLSQSQKDDILTKISPFSVVSIGVEFVDPLFLYINPTVEVFYDPQDTDATAGDIRDDVAQAVIDFESDRLGRFDRKKFRYSVFVNGVDEANDGIVNNLTDITMSKRFVPDTSRSTNYKINFNNSIKVPLRHESSESVDHEGEHFIESSAFTYQGERAFFDDDGEGTLRIYRVSGNRIIYLERDAGTVDYERGLISIDSIQIEGFEGDYLEITATPEENDVTAVRNQILLIGSTRIDVVNDRTDRVVATTTDVTTTGVETNVVETGVTSVVI